MNDKRYWDDAYRLAFEAQIVARADSGQLLGVALDGTYFYPEGGGQPADKGTLGGLPVVDVQSVDGRIVHYLDSAQADEAAFAAGQSLAGEIDAATRKQNMRAHTGAHLLFGAARKLFSTLEYAGFDIHGGGGSLYLQTGGTIGAGQMHRMLEYANSAVVDERATSTYIVKPEEVAAIPGCVYNVELPPDNVRIVEIEGWDVAVCSGTHLARSIEVGPIGIVGRQAHKKGISRLDYVVGQAAVTDIANSERALDEVGTLLNSPRHEAPQAARTLVSAVSEERKRAEKLEAQLAAYRLDALLPQAEIIGDTRLAVGIIPGVAQDALRPLVAKAVKSELRIVVAIVGHAGQTFVVAGRSDDVDLDLREPVVAVARRHGGGGGGAPELVAAGGMQGDPEAVVADLRDTLDGTLA